jgi:hypothetical protein
MGTVCQNMKRSGTSVHAVRSDQHFKMGQSAQTGYIASQPFADRCLKEMDYVPYKILSQPSDTSLAFLPLIESLQQDPLDPLDP